jgi:hypothetical protein
VNRIADDELWISIFQATDELVSFKKSKFAVLGLGFEKLGREVDNCGQPKPPIVASIIYAWSRKAGHVALVQRILEDLQQD